MKKFLLVILTVLMLFSAVTVASCKEQNASDQEFVFHDFGTYLGVSLNKLKSKNVVIPSEYDGKPVLSIMDDGFKNSDLITVDIPDSIVLIGKNAFINCSNLVSVNLTENSNLDRIKEYAFSNCDGLMEMFLPSKVKFIERNAFYSCDNLAEINLQTVTGYLSGTNGNGRTESVIGDYAFAYCSKLTEVTLKAYNIGNNAFYGSGVKKATLGSEILSLGLNVFGGCNSLQELNLAFVGGKKTGEGYLGYLFGANLAEDNGRYVPTTLNKITINGGRAIYSKAFYNTDIKEVVLSSSIKKIESQAFANCDKLQNVNLAYLEEICEEAFLNCASIYSLTTSANLSSIEKNAFSGCSSLTEVAMSGDWMVGTVKDNPTDSVVVTDSTANASMLTGINCSKYWSKNA